MSVPRALAAVVALAAVLLLAAVVVVGQGAPTASAPNKAVGSRPPVPVRAAGPSAEQSAQQSAQQSALRVLHAWDARRAAAYRSGTPARLAGLYVAGSEAGAADVRLLRDYRARGFRVARMRTAVLAVQVLDARRGRLRLRVSDRLAGAVAVRGSERVPLPRDAVSTRVVVLGRAADGRWRVASVTDRPATAPGAAPPRAGRRPSGARR